MTWPALQTRILQANEGETFALSGGDQARFKVTGRDSQGRFAFLEFIAQPGHPGAPAHVHAGHEELWYILEGELQMLVDDKVFTATPGSTFLVPRGVTHAFRNTRDHPCKFAAVFCPAGLEGHMVERAERLKHGSLTREEAEALARTYDMTLVQLPPHSLWNQKTA